MRLSYLSAASLLILLPYAIGELPSCYRARCSHCAVEFIANMCPTTCGACGIRDVTYGPKLRPGRPLHAGTSSSDGGGYARVHGVPAVVTQSTAQRELQLPAGGDAPQEVSAPIAQQLPEYSGAFSAQAQQQQQFITQQQANGQQYLSQQQQIGIPQQQSAQTTSYGSSYGLAYPQQQQLGQLPQQQFQSFAFPQPQQQQPYYGASAFQQPSPTFLGQTVATPPSQAPTQPFNFFQPPQHVAGQPAPAPFLNPFQPFLQHSLQAQQQASFFQPFTQSPALPGFATPAPPTAAIGQSAGFALPSASTLTNYLPAQPQPHPAQPYNTQGQQYTYISQTPNAEQQIVQIPSEAQRLKQIYAQPQPLTQPQPQPQIISQPPVVQSYNIPQVPPSQQIAPTPANSIDAPPIYVNKNSYGDKNGDEIQMCPKQPNWQPCVSKEVANERFRNCCHRLGDGCSQLCSYDQTLATIQIAVLTGRCPLGKVADMMICASGYEDATACCQAYNVFEPGFEHCRPYCNPAAGLPNDGMLAEKYRCLGKLSQIQRCFYVSQKP